MLLLFFSVSGPPPAHTDPKGTAVALDVRLFDVVAADGGLVHVVSSESSYYSAASRDGLIYFAIGGDR